MHVVFITKFFKIIFKEILILMIDYFENNEKFELLQKINPKIQFFLLGLN